MNLKGFLEIEKNVVAFREQFIDTPDGRIPKSIVYLAQAIDAAAMKSDQAALYPLLLAECSRVGNDALHIRFARQQVQSFPDTVVSRTNLAAALSKNPKAQDEALRVAFEAVTLAKKQNRQVKYSLTCLARIALEAKDYSSFQMALHGLIDDADNNRGYEDHGYEFDFLEQLDPTRVDADLVARYRALQHETHPELVLSNELIVRYDPDSERLAIFHPDTQLFTTPLVDMKLSSLNSEVVGNVAKRIGKMLMLLIPELRAAVLAADNPPEPSEIEE